MNPFFKHRINRLALPLGVVVLTTLAFISLPSEQNICISTPVDVASSEDGTLAVSDYTRCEVHLLREGDKEPVVVAGLQNPFGLAWVDANRLAVTEYGGHTIAIIDTRKGKITNRIETVKYPMGLSIGLGGKLLVAGFGRSEAALVDTEQGREVARVPVPYQPDFTCFTPDGKFGLLTHLTPGTSEKGTMVSVIDIDAGTLLRTIELPFGSTNARGIAVSPNSRWAYVAHTLGKVMLPTSQLERGWVVTNVFSIIDLEEMELYATLPFDYTTFGASDPWGITLSPDGHTLYATLAGVHELAVVDIETLHRYLSGDSWPEDLRANDANAQTARDVWQRIYEDPSRRMELADQFSALPAAGLIRRVTLPVEGPRGISVSPGDGSLTIAGYYSGELVILGKDDLEASAVISLHPEGEPTLAQVGEAIFHDGGSTYQGWLSCASCHPSGRADGLNWDLLNDGIGNPKNAKSLLLSHETPPSMTSGIRANYEVASKAGFHYIKFNDADTAMINAVRAYLREMKPDPSPFLEEGQLSASARKGKELFESGEVGCIGCHSGPYFTDMQMHAVGSKGKYDRRDDFDTPSLVEAWRSAPYLHDGSVEKIEDLFSGGNANTQHWHGRTKELKPGQVEDLVAYVKSI